MYHPRVFQKNIQKTKEVEKMPVIINKEQVIPENTLYEEPLVRHTKPTKKHVTIFGFSQKNLEHVIKRIKETCQIEHIEYGLNWINVITNKDSALLKLNLSHINGEIIGVYKESNNSLIEDKDIFLRKEGIIRKIIIYLFGE
ncbi:hypothetical protein NCER_100682 [Vairimorpha ceranae BRL01]|uniref:Uncharacterized protein n=2 Tax=Vairimorpha ceranae TaxID=40302 RepID=C4V874_VAIC1|nr:atp-dependent 26s proteasome regulatory subunit [Vairimorpha ceranae]EEQ82574.1 hypothetical protein NCER_100682 [Vairimorpha ceranae BRL01]KAF5141356.1 hypothetical protein G9O61_00g006730 [Vairimorpha ceranae]KKO76374.1 atp-dependent 26s proteasome regulatory subunit [Vairimorpha ceranae]